MRAIVAAILVVFLNWPALATAQVSHLPGRFVSVPEGRIWYESEGEGEPLILIAGGPGLSHSYLHPWFTPLGDRFQLVYFDAFGTGRSSRAATPTGYSVAQAVEHLEALRRSLRSRRINLFGHSYGGIVALAYADKYPDRVNRLAISGIVASGEELQLMQDNLNYVFRNQVPQAWERLRILREHGVTSNEPAHQEAYAYPGAMLNFYNPENAQRMPSGEPDYYNPDLWYAMGGRDADFRLAGELRAWDVRGTVSSLRMPMLVLSGRYDRLIYPALVERWRTYAPGALLRFLEKSGHFTFIEEPEETINLLREFFTAS